MCISLRPQKDQNPPPTKRISCSAGAFIAAQYCNALLGIVSFGRFLCVTTQYLVPFILVNIAFVYNWDEFVRRNVIIMRGIRANVPVASAKASRSDARTPLLHNSAPHYFFGGHKKEFCLQNITFILKHVRHNAFSIIYFILQSFTK